MEISRYITTQGVLLKDKTIIPIWDSRATFSKNEMYGNQISVEGERQNTYSLVECIFDLKTKTISAGIDIDIYPDLSKLEHKINDIVLFEDKSKHSLTKIVDIIFEEYDLQITKGKKIDNWYLNNFPKDVVVNRDSLYAMKIWKPTYVFENGGKTIWSMYVRTIQNLDYLKK
jgi:hypothetical protein